MGLDFISKLKPVKYKLKSENKTHYGLIAQEVKQLLDDSKINKEDFGGYVEEDGQLGLRYSEFIPILIKGQQELYSMLKNLEEKISKL